MTFPRTKFQRWLKKHFACYAGRKRVGNKTLQQWWITSRTRDDMQWLLLNCNSTPYTHEIGCNIQNTETCKRCAFIFGTPRQIRKHYKCPELP